MERRQLLLAVAVFATFGLGGCSGGPSAQDADWNHLPGGTQGWVAAAVEDRQCAPIRNTYNYVLLMEDNEPASPLQEYLKAQYDEGHCDIPSPGDLIQQAAGQKLSIDDMKTMSSKDLNPLYHGPGCIGVLLTMEDVKNASADGGIEDGVARLALGTSAILDSLPAAVTKTGQREPTRTEDAAMRIAAQLTAFGDALLNTSSEGQGDFDRAVSNLSLLETEYQVACMAEYDEGPIAATK